VSLDLTDLRERTIAHEGKKPFLYLDTASPPRVTVGIGKAVTLSQALALPFTIGDRPATVAEITADYKRVAGATGGLRADAYSHLSTCRLSEEAIVALFEASVAEFEGQLRKLFPDFDSFPDAAKLGCLDVIFQVGAGNLKAHFPKFVKAVRAKDWAVAAVESHRSESSEARNDAVAALFTQASIERRVN